MVGKVHVVFDDLTTNRPGASPTTREYTTDPPRFAKGEEWGRFEFGSTIVLLAAPGLPSPCRPCSFSPWSCSAEKP